MKPHTVKYDVLRSFHHGGTLCAPGGTVYLAPSDAVALIRLGKIADVVNVKASTLDTFTVSKPRAGLKK